MIALPDLSAVPLFSEVNPADLERLAQKAADISLAAGEYAVHEGDERALLVVLSGKLEVLKVIDGIQRPLPGAFRRQGTLLGEVPLIFGVQFQASFRAVEPTRVMRIEAVEYHWLAGAYESVAKRIGDLARERLGGLQNITAQPAKPRALIVGHSSTGTASSCGGFSRATRSASSGSRPTRPGSPQNGPDHRPPTTLRSSARTARSS